MNILDPFVRHEQLQHRTRRHFLRDCASGLGALWFATEAGRAWGSRYRWSRVAEDSEAVLRAVARS